MGRLGYKVAIVTGGAQGFGAGAAEALALEGATVLMTGAGGEAFAGALRERGLQAEHHRLDAGDPLSWAALVDKIMRTHGHLDVLVNQAGENISITIEDATAAQLREILEADLIGPFLGTKAVIAAMRQSGGGSIINIAANPIVGILPLYALYGAAKAALLNLTKTTAVHCIQRGYGIRVNAVHPGTHETQLLTDNAIRSTTAPNVSTLLGSLPAHATGTLHDFGEAITYLAADGSQHITGADIFCTGALTELALAAQNG
jgi:NAD(P)-dependent dehydrogenase (short-subunit alcohol dehydrogenase family)